MKLATILLVLIGLVNGQLNFEGNPLTENTEYTAVESRLLEKTARQKVAENTTDILTESSENFHPSSLFPDVNNSNQSANQQSRDHLQGPSSVEHFSKLQDARRITALFGSLFTKQRKSQERRTKR